MKCNIVDGDRTDVSSYISATEVISSFPDIVYVAKKREAFNMIGCCIMSG